MTPTAPITVTRQPSPSGFLAAARELLSGEEALNSLPLGIADALSRGRRYGKEAPLLLTLERAQTVMGSALQTPPYNLVLSRLEQDAIDRLVEWLREHDVQLPGVTGEIEAATSFAAAYLDPGVESRVERNSRLFELRLVIDPPHPGGSMRVAVASDRELVRALWAEFQAEATPGRPGAQSSVDFQLDAGKVWLWIDETGEPTCIAARNRELPTGASIGPVYTPPQRRAHGYATALVAGLSRTILSEGKAYVSLFTDLSNPISNSIYPKVGYQPVADMIDLSFSG